MKIERLLLGNNSIQELNFLSFWGLEYSLETLDLSYNNFRRVPFEALRLLRNLRSLSLTGNRISKLEHYDFGFMRKLEVLAVDHNPIVSIDRYAFESMLLSTLFTSVTFISSPSFIHSPQSFTVITLILIDLIHSSHSFTRIHLVHVN